MAGLTLKRRTMANTIAGVVLVAAILILVNVILAGIPARLDLTEGKEFTVSGATKDVLRGLTDLVTITVYMSEDLPPQLSTLRRQISDTLDEYRNYGRGKVQIDFVNPKQDPQTEQRMRSLGIPEIMAQTVQKDQLQVVNIYLGMVISHLDRQEVIPVVQDTYTLEYDLTAAILKVSQSDEYVIGILSDSPEVGPTQAMSAVQELLSKQFRVQTVSLEGGEREVPADVDLLIVAAPARIPDRAKFRIDQFVMRGGRAIFLIDAIRLPEGGGLQAFPLDSGLEDLLAGYGVRVQKSLVVDRASCATASFSGGYVRYTVPYPYWPKAVPDLLNRDHPITSRLESLVLPWAAPLRLDVPIGPGDPIANLRDMLKADRKAREEMARKLGTPLPPEEDVDQAAAEGEGSAAAAAGARVVANVLARSSPRATTVSGRYDLSPQQNFPQGPTSSMILAVALSGRFDSFYRNRPVPPPATPEQTPGETPVPETSASTANDTVIPESPETRILVVGNGMFASDNFLNQFPENSVFLLNAVDWMTLGDQLISIRSRGATDRPLKTISDGAKSTIKLAGILGAPLLVIAFGLVRFTLRRRAWSAREVAAREA